MTVEVSSKVQLKKSDLKVVNDIFLPLNNKLDTQEEAIEWFIHRSGMKLSNPFSGLFIEKISSYAVPESKNG